MTHDFDPARPPLIDEDRNPIFDRWEIVENTESLDFSEGDERRVSASDQLEPAHLR